MTDQTNAPTQPDELEAERDALERWKAEALPVLSGLQEIGKALDLPMGARITGPEAAEAAESLRSERDTLRATVERVEALADQIRASTNAFMADYEEQGRGQSTRMSGEAAAMHVAALSQVECSLRAALAAGSPAPEGDPRAARDERQEVIADAIWEHVVDAIDGNLPSAARALMAVEDVHAVAHSLIERLDDAGATVLSSTSPAPEAGDERTSVLQSWVTSLPMMQQTVLLTAVRGPDGLPKYHPTKWLLRWYRRCILLSALDGKVLDNPHDSGGGSFTGPSVDRAWAWSSAMDDRVTEYLRALDEVPHHFQLHLLHAIEIVGYKHPDYVIRNWWFGVYERLVHDMHLWPETEEQLDARLGDTREGWLARGDVATND